MESDSESESTRPDSESTALESDPSPSPQGQSPSLDSSQSGLAPTLLSGSLFTVVSNARLIPFPK